LNSQKSGLYVHIPFCEKKCNYCDFYSIEKYELSKNFQQTYLNALIQDLKEKKEKYFINTELSSIFFGGGTPSIFDPDFYFKFLYEIKNIFTNTNFNNIEISMEANPESLCERKINEYKRAGINRLNIGIQSRKKEFLNYLGRKSTIDEVDLLKALHQSEFENYGIDLIYSLPMQNWNDIKQDIDWAIDNNVKHISLYSLTIEKKTKLEKEIFLKKKKKPSEKRSFIYQKIITEYLKKNSYNHYEVSNFAKNKFECEHNLNYWRYRPYIGLGASAHSFNGKVRIINTTNIKNYIKQNKYKLVSSQLNPDLFIGIFRITEFQPLSKFKKIMKFHEFLLFQKKIIEFANKNWINIKKTGFNITENGLLQSDTMLIEMSNILSREDEKLFA